MPPTLSIQKPMPFAIPISFTANYPLETCRQILTNSEVVPSMWERAFTSQMTFSLRIVSADRYEFEGERRTSRFPIIAGGYLDKISDQTTAVMGYVDATGSFYAMLVLFFSMGLPASLFFFADVPQSTLFKLGFGVLIFGGAIILALIGIRVQVYEFAGIIKTTLADRSG